jgi:hypothetical protein
VSRQYPFAFVGMQERYLHHLWIRSLATLPSRVHVENIWRGEAGLTRKKHSDPQCLYCDEDTSAKHHTRRCGYANSQKFLVVITKAITMSTIAQALNVQTTVFCRLVTL